MGRNKKSATLEDFQSEGVGIMLAGHEDLVVACTGGLGGGGGRRFRGLYNTCQPQSPNHTLCGAEPQTTHTTSTLESDP